MNFDLTILGSGSALPTSRRYSTAQALQVHERFFLIDCGEGTQLQLRNAKVKLSNLNHIFISHLHGDHIFGIFGLLSTFNLLGRKSDLSIFGPPGIEKIISFYRENFAEEIQYKIFINPFLSRSFHSIFESKSIEIFAFPLKHRVPTWGFLFREKQKEPNLIKDAISKYNLGIKDILRIKAGHEYFTESGLLIPKEDLVLPTIPPRSYAFCSDTAYYERLIEWVRGVDLLYHEATFANADKKIAKQTGHSTAYQAALIASSANVKKLIIGHFSNRYKDVSLLLSEAQSIFSETYLAEDLDVIKIL